MTNIQQHFQHKEADNGNNHIYLKTDSGLEIEFLIMHDECTEVYLDGYEHSANSEINFGIFIQKDGEIHRLSEVIKEIESYWNDGAQERACTARIEARNAVELSSPFSTGRI